LFDALAAEDAHQIVFQREEKTRRAGIALASGAATELIVNAAGFMALGAEDVQAAERDDFIVFGFALLRELIVDRLPLVRGNLKNFAFVLEENHGHGGRR